MTEEIVKNTVIDLQDATSEELLSLADTLLEVSKLLQSQGLHLQARKTLSKDRNNRISNFCK